MNEDALTLFQPQNLEQAMKMADVLAKSTLLPDPLRGKPGDVLVTIITGQELGLTAMQAIRGMHVIKGKAIMSADLQVALVKKHPDCVFFRLVESTDAVATYETQRKGEPEPTRLSFTIEQGRQAGLGGDNWRKYPAAMLRARAAAALARAVFPDTMLGVYDESEAVEIAKPERDVTPAPAEPTPPTEAPTRSEVGKSTQTERIKEAIKAKAKSADAVIEAPRPSLVVDVKAEESEEQAQLRQQQGFDVGSMSAGELADRASQIESWLDAAAKQHPKRLEGELKLSLLKAELEKRQHEVEANP